MTNPTRVSGALATADGLLARVEAATPAIGVAQAADQFWMAVLCWCPPDEATALAERVRELRNEAVEAIRRNNRVGAVTANNSQPGDEDARRTGD